MPTSLHWCFPPTRGAVGWGTNFQLGEQTLPLPPGFDLNIAPSDRRHLSLPIKGRANCSCLWGTQLAVAIIHRIVFSLAYSQPCELLQDICGAQEL